MEKYGNKSPAKKFLHRYTGIIIVGIILAAIIPLYLLIVSEQEFFESWSCGNLEWYALTYNQDIYRQDFPDHDHLSVSQHDKFHEVMSECDFVFEHK